MPADGKIPRYEEFTEFRSLRGDEGEKDYVLYGFDQFYTRCIQKRLGEDIVGVTSRAMIPHEAFIQIKVVRITTELKDFARTMVEEFDELGRRVSIDVVRQ